MSQAHRIIVALSGGVDSAVAAWLLSRQGHVVECLHMTNWEDDDGYCSAARDLADARRVCERLGLPLHRVNFAREYRDAVFAAFLDETRAGRTPNPDVLCNREIKFGVLRRYAGRLGATRLATGHYARLDALAGERVLLRAADARKDQTYFLHAVASADLTDVEFPLGSLTKAEVRQLAAEAGLAVADKRDSTGICFIGERPFGEFIGRFIDASPGPIVTPEGETLGEHRGLHLYTLGQRKGIGLGGMDSREDSPWYVAAKRPGPNELVVVQGHDHPALFSEGLATRELHWIGPEPEGWAAGASIRCSVKTRYRQPDQGCRIVRTGPASAEVRFDRPQRAVTPGQFAVFYLGDRCLGGAAIERTHASGAYTEATAEAC